MFATESMADLNIPGDDFVPGWKKTDRMRRFRESDLFNYINGGAEIFHEFGFRVLFVQHYGKDEEEISLEIYQMESPESALGIYLTKCGKETTIPGIMVRHSGNRYQITIVKNNYYLLLNNATGVAANLPVMTALVNQVLDSIPEGNKIELFDMLPKNNLIDGSKRIIRGPFALEPIFTFGEGDILQLRGRVFGIVGDYRSGNDHIFTRILIPYPDKETVISVYEHLIAHLDPYLDVLISQKQGFIFKDYQDKFGVAKLYKNVIDIRIHLLIQPVFDSK